jgi:hypothetical protein
MVRRWSSSHCDRPREGDEAAHDGQAASVSMQEVPSNQQPFDNMAISSRQSNDYQQSVRLTEHYAMNRSEGLKHRARTNEERRSCSRKNEARKTARMDLLGTGWLAMNETMSRINEDRSRRW